MLAILIYGFLIFTGGESISISNVRDDPSIQIGCVKCHKVDKDKLNVHLVPHSHDDVGWLKTVDQYYYGLNTTIQKASVQYIITTVVEALLENPDRRYIQVETAFFWKWWKSQSDDMREKFKYLVDNGQIEMVNGAWSMNDEACSNYQSTIDQFTWGLRTINDTIGNCGIPRVGWQIDPFGHSREQASLFAQLGFDGMFFARLDHDDKSQREKNRTLDFAWQGSANLENSIIFGGTFPTSMYMPPYGYCWDYSCDDAPFVDDIDSPEYNADRLVSNFILIVKQYAKYLPSNNVFIPMGGDFQYEAAEKNYINMDRFINAFRDEDEVNVIYSTPSCYIKAVNDANPELLLKTDDFFPYSNDMHSFWTGYFTSRPNSKRFERQTHNVLQAVKQLVAFYGLRKYDYENDIKPLEQLREVLGIMQHHDAITGTEKQHVANDYVRLMTRAIEIAEEPIGKIVGELLRIDRSEEVNITLELSSCLLSNVSICNVTQDSDRFVVVVYNPLAWNVTHYIRLPIDVSDLTIEGPDGEEEFDLVNPIPYFHTEQEELQSSKEVVFAARNIPPLGIKVYYITKTKTEAESFKDSVEDIEDSLFFGNEETNFQIETETNLLKSVTVNGKTLNVTQNFYYYYSETGERDKSNIASGAYLFRPTNATTQDLKNGVTRVEIVRGKVVEEFHQKWNDEKINVSQIIRVYKNEGYIEFDWLVGGIDIDIDNMGKEVITKYMITNPFQNNNTFYTDSNGREMMKRVINTRPDYTYNPIYEPVAGNYYPVTSKIVIKDDNTQFSILTDRSEGGTSLKDGVIELMLHRRIIHDDNKGVAESLNETEFGTGVYVRGTHRLIIGSATELNPNGKSTDAQERILAQKKLIQPWIGVGNADSDDMTFDHLKTIINLNYSAIANELPENVNILTFEPWTDDTYLLRLEHILEKDEDPSLSNSVTIELKRLFTGYIIDEITETTLGANQWLDEYQNQTKYTWNITGESLDVVPDEEDPSELTISLTPMEIRTFVVKLNPYSLSFGHLTQPFSYMLLVTLLAYVFF